LNVTDVASYLLDGAGLLVDAVYDVHDAMCVHCSGVGWEGERERERVGKRGWSDSETPS